MAVLITIVNVIDHVIDHVADSVKDMVLHQCSTQEVDVNDIEAAAASGAASVGIDFQTT